MPKKSYLDIKSHAIFCANYYYDFKTIVRNISQPELDIRTIDVLLTNNLIIIHTKLLQLFRFRSKQIHSVKIPEGYIRMNNKTDNTSYPKPHFHSMPESAIIIIFVRPSFTVRSTPTRVFQRFIAVYKITYNLSKVTFRNVW